MKIKVLKHFATFSHAYDPGDVVDMPEGEDWVTAGLAEPVKKRRTSRKKTDVRNTERTEKLPDDNGK